MTQAIISILKAISNGRVAVADGKQLAEAALPMIPLQMSELHQIVGGDDSTLPKGGWKAA